MAPYARQTERWRQALLALAYASSAEMAGHVFGWLGYRTSPDTLIQHQRAERFFFTSPRVIGMDEFALRRAVSNSTLVVDLERHQSIAAIEGRTAETIQRGIVETVSECDLGCFLQSNGPQASHFYNQADLKLHKSRWLAECRTQ